MTSHLDYQTQKLKRSILELVTLVEDSVQKAITAFQEKNLEFAKQVVEGDKQIDAMKSILRRSVSKSWPFTNRLQSTSG